MALSFLHLVLLGLSYSQTAFVLAPIREHSQIFGGLHALGVTITTVLTCPLVYPATQSPLLPGVVVLNSFVWGVGLYAAIKYYVQFRQRRTAS